MTFRIAFPGTRFEPLMLPPHAPLSLHLTAQNSPVLFGCREGVCGSCLIRVDNADGLAPASAHEAEALAVYAPDLPDARLACQLDLTADIALRRP